MAHMEAIFSHPQIAQSTENLSEWVVSRADTAKRETGFGWVVDDTRAPRTYDQLTAAYKASAESGTAYPVAAVGSATSIYGFEVNSAFRYLHDMTHARQRQNFSPQGELVVATTHLNDLTDDGFEFGGLEWQLLFADTVGQIIFGTRHISFVNSQTVFAYDLVTKGIEAAVQQSR
jgi:hypothetical protein